MNRVGESAAITRNSSSPGSAALNHQKPRTPEKDGRIATTSAPTTAGNGVFAGHGSSSAARSYASNLEVKLEAVDRLQTQMNLNRASMEGFSRELQALTRELQMNVAEIHAIKVTHNSFVDQTEHYTKALNELHSELAALKQEVAGLRANAANAANAAQPAATAPSGERMDDQTLEILTTNLATVSAKANEVDNLRLGHELLKRRLTRLEEQVVPISTPPKGESSSHPHDSHHKIAPQPPHGSPPTHNHVGQQDRRAGPMHYNVPQNHADHRHSRHSYGEMEHHGSGWSNVNKRPHTSDRPHANGVEAAQAPDELSPSKRQRLLAPLEPRRQHDSTRYDPTRHEAPREQPVAYHRTESNESYPESTDSAAYHAAMYHDREAAHEAERQRAASMAYGSSAVPGAHQTSPNSRGRGRGGRPRKYMPADRTAWQSEKAAIIDGQVVHRGPDGQWYAMGPADSSRRSSIAIPSAAMSPATQAAVLHQHQTAEYSPGAESVSRDPYAHTKKTRTKPVRNQEGVLIRKDGRPDMRSHSSAANLRKVHAKKEQERRMEAGGGPYGHSHQGSVAETRGISMSSTPGPLSHRPSDAGHHDDHYEHDDHNMKREDGDGERLYPDMDEERYHRTPSEEEQESLTTPESLKAMQPPRHAEKSHGKIREEHRDDRRNVPSHDEVKPPDVENEAH